MFAHPALPRGGGDARHRSRVSRPLPPRFNPRRDGAVAGGDEVRGGERGEGSRRVRERAKTVDVRRSREEDGVRRARPSRARSETWSVRVSVFVSPQFAGQLAFVAIITAAGARTSLCPNCHSEDSRGSTRGSWWDDARTNVVDPRPARRGRPPAYRRAPSVLSCERAPSNRCRSRRARRPCRAAHRSFALAHSW